jgi:hypothetical protein
VDNRLDYIDGADLILLGCRVHLLSGGKSLQLEFVRKNEGLQGWIAYTYPDEQRTLGRTADEPGINNGGGA